MPSVNEINDDPLAMGAGSTEKIFRIWGRNQTHVCDNLLKRVDAWTVENALTIELQELLVN